MAKTNSLANPLGAYPICSSFIATCANIGRLRPASGTWGSAAAIVCCAILELVGGGKVACAILAITSFCCGVPAAHAYGILKKKPDHSNIVIDEFAAQAAMLVFIPLSFYSISGYAPYALAFLLFRLCDIVKPFPANLIDKKWKNGWGVMLDDVVAALWALLLLWLFDKLLAQAIPAWDAKSLIFGG